MSNEEMKIRFSNVGYALIARPRGGQLKFHFLPRNELVINRDAVCCSSKHCGVPSRDRTLFQLTHFFPYV